MEKLNEHLSINLSGDKYPEVVIRHGEALPPVAPQKLSIPNGRFTAVSDYIKVKKEKANDFQKLSTENTIVLVDRKNLFIHLFANPNDKFSAEIKANLKLNQDLIQFHINGNKTFDRLEFLKLLRMAGPLFNDKEEWNKIVKSYQSFTAKTSGDMKMENDNRGNKLVHYQKQVETSIPQIFTLKLPIFEGELDSTFHVNILLDVSDAGSIFWFESTELIEITDNLKNKLFNRELEWCREFTCIEI